MLKVFNELYKRKIIFKIEFTVISEDNTQKDYVLIVNKSEKFCAVFLTITVLSLAGVSCYKYQKKKKQLLLHLIIKHFVLPIIRVI